MCEAKPGCRCAAETIGPARRTALAYRDAYPTGGPIDPLTAATAALPTPTDRAISNVVDRVNDPRYLVDVEELRVVTLRREAFREAARAAREAADGPAHRDFIAAARDAYFTEIGLRDRIDTYRAGTVEALAGVDPNECWTGTDTRQMLPSGFIADGPIPTTDAERITLSRSGIDGADAGALTCSTNTRRLAIINAKADPTPPEEAQLSPWAAADRAWTPVVVHQFAAEHPELEVLRNDTVYRNPDEPWQVATFHATLRSPGTDVPDGVLRVVTSGSPSAWEDGVPSRHRMALLHDMEAAGAEYGYVSVVINDHDIRTFRIEAGEPVNVTDPAQRGYRDHADKLAKEWAQITRRVEALDAKYGPRKPRKVPFEATDATFAQAAAFRGEPVATTRARYEELRASGLDVTPAIERLHAEGRKGDIVCVDLETTSFTPDTGEILEIGMERRDANGRVVGRYQEVFSVDPRFAALRGTGAVDVHQITLEDTRGKRTFAEASKDVARFLGIGSGQPVTLVAHNSAQFERPWLDASVPGFLEARQQPADDTLRPQVHELDTMRLSQRAVHSTSSNTLRSFVERFGVTYEGAHRALADSQMTGDALDAFTREAQRVGTTASL